MDKKLLIEKIKGLTKIYNKTAADGPDEYILEIIKNLIDEYLVKNPEDTDVRLRLAMLEFTLPWEDPELISKYLNEIFKYDPGNVYATLTLACIQYTLWGKITNEAFSKLNNLSSENPEINSMIELAKAWYYEYKNNNELYEKRLLSSINYYDKHVENYRSLAYFYTQKGKKDEAKKFAKKALDNVKVVYAQDFSTIDITDIEKFINEYLKGTHITDSNLKSIYELLK